MVIPGALWSAIFIVLSMLPNWLEVSFPGSEWLTPVAGAILIALKVWEVYKPSDAPKPAGNFEMASAPAVKAAKSKRFLLG